MHSHHLCQKRARRALLEQKEVTATGLVGRQVARHSGSTP